MGGTSYDVCLIRDGEIPTTDYNWVGDERVAMKMVDVPSVGAGGGSIAWIDTLGLLRVGSQSAGADPGPACYDRGGTEPTVTDADLLLGYVPADYFLGGEIALRRDLAERAIRSVTEPLKVDVPTAAMTIFTTVNSVMADKMSEISTKRGYDGRDSRSSSAEAPARFMGLTWQIFWKSPKSLFLVMLPLTARSACSTWGWGKNFARH